jgi:heme-degrading monooxygenase HmoA
MTTYARIVTGQLKSATIDEGVRAFTEKVTPNLKKQPGFKSAELLVNRKTGKMASVSHFASEADAQAGGQAGLKERVAMLEPYLDGPTHLEIYEVNTPS